jgi:hypothetical protein
LTSIQDTEASVPDRHLDDEENAAKRGTADSDWNLGYARLSIDDCRGRDLMDNWEVARGTERASNRKANISNRR